MSLSPGTMVGPYRITGELGRGAMAIVYEAVQVDLARTVALKILDSKLHGVPEVVKRFETEAEAVGRLDHPNIVRVIERGRADGHYFIAMELVRGTSLDRVIETRRRRMSDGELRFDREHVEWSVNIVIGVLRGLAYAHEHGVIHRDVKPQNIIVGDDGRPRIVDFGLARLNNGTGVTMTGQVIGTPSYMSPEQAQPGLYPLDHRTDIYSAGVTLYELLALELPFSGRDSESVVHSIVHRSPHPLRGTNPHLPRDIEIIVLEAMQKAPDDRYPTAAAFADDLERFINFAEIHARPAGPFRRFWRILRANRTAAIAIAVAVATVVTAIVLLTSTTRYRLVLNIQRGPAELFAYPYSHTSGNWGVPARVGETHSESELISVLLPEGDYFIVAVADGGRWSERLFPVGPDMSEEDDGLIRLFTDEEVVAGMVLVPGGEFEFGWNDTYAENPVHRQTLPEFWIDENAATLEEIESTLDLERRTRLGKNLARTDVVRQLTWFEAANYLAAFGKRLPTEFEVEAALRGPLGGASALPLEAIGQAKVWTCSRFEAYDGWRTPSRVRDHQEFNRTHWVTRGISPDPRVEYSTYMAARRDAFERPRSLGAARGVRRASAPR